MISIGTLVTSRLTWVMPYSSRGNNLLNLNGGIIDGYGGEDARKFTDEDIGIVIGKRKQTRWVNNKADCLVLWHDEIAWIPESELTCIQ